MIELLEEARRLLEEGRAVTPLRARDKQPFLKDWPNKVLTEQDVEHFFGNGHCNNLGVILGRSRLVDVDLDCPEAVALAPHILPATGLIHGRDGAPSSHMWYQAVDGLCSRTIRDPSIDEARSTIVELRIDDHVTLVPPSIHPSGEKLAYVSRGEAALSDAPTLTLGVNLVGALVLVARTWPQMGARHDAALALGGFLARGGYSKKDVANIARTVVELANDSEVTDRVRAAQDSVERHSRRETTRGLPKLLEVLDLDDQRRKRLNELVAVKNESDESVREDRLTSAVRLGLEADLFHHNSEAFAVIHNGARQEAVPLSGRAFRSWVSGLYYRKHGSVLSGQALTDAVRVVEAEALASGQDRPIHVRTAERAGAILLDLATREGHVVRIRPDKWEILTNPDVPFRRTQSMHPLPLPRSGGTIERLRPFLNVADDADWVLTVAWAVAALYPHGPFPILLLLGEQGSAKSTTARILRALIDPNSAPLRASPRDGRDLVITATNAHMVAFDNLTRIDPWLSDALCRLSTGGGFAVRRLYTNDEEMIFDAQRPILINGIDEPTARPDFLDRAIVVSLPSIPEDERRTERELWATFERERPYILGALLDGVAAALRNLPHVHLSQAPRMADFAQFMVAAEEGLGWSSGTFMRAYSDNRVKSNATALEESPIYASLRRLLERTSNYAWTGTASDLKDVLDGLAEERVRKHHTWPGSARGLRGALDRIAPNLRAAGIQVSYHRTGDERTISIHL